MDILYLLGRYIFAPLAAFKDNEKHFSILKQLRKTQYLSKNELEAYQQDKLNKLIIHAFDNVPFYKERFKAARINPHKDKIKDYFHDIPFLTKEDIQKNLTDLIATNYDRDKLIANKTGGSTGKPLRYFHNQAHIDFMKARELRHNQWAGWNIADKIGCLWGAQRDFDSSGSIKKTLRNWLIDRCLILDSTSLTEERMLNFAKELTAFKPKGILAYANSLYEFAKFVKEQNITGIAPQSIITSAEVLHEHERELIEKVFGCKIFNRYGCREVSVMASECEKHHGMHIAADCLVMEFIKDDGTPVKPQEEGNVIITDLFNWGMPFIRYKNEDTAVPTDRECSCGIKLPLIEKVSGRITDLLITPEGVKVSGVSVATYLIANTPGIKQAQFVQDKIDELVLKLVKADDFSEDTLQFLDSKLPDFFGDQIKFEYQFVDDIPKTATGKYRFSICNVAGSENAIR
jgi:phenylacetate-CoA ligase